MTGRGVVVVAAAVVALLSGCSSQSPSAPDSGPDTSSPSPVTPAPTPTQTEFATVTRDVKRESEGVTCPTPSVTYPEPGVAIVCVTDPK